MYQAAKKLAKGMVSSRVIKDTKAHSKVLCLSYKLLDETRINVSICG